MNQGIRALKDTEGYGQSKFTYIYIHKFTYIYVCTLFANTEEKFTNAWHMEILH